MVTSVLSVGTLTSAFTFRRLLAKVKPLYVFLGISPSIYTQDWIEASRERDRAENSYPFTRYLDRRRKVHS